MLMKSNSIVKQMFLVALNIHWLISLPIFQIQNCTFFKMTNDNKMVSTLIVEENKL